MPFIVMLFRINGQITSANSAICVYQMDEINAVFKNAKFKGQGNSFYSDKSINSLWLPPFDGDVPDPRPGTVSSKSSSS